MVLLTSMGFFLVGSILSAVSQSIIMLIVFRAISGIGGGGILTSVMITVSDVVSLEKRGTYQGILGVVVALSNSIGPLVGGLFTEKVSWWWCFYINIPLNSIRLFTHIIQGGLSRFEISRFFPTKANQTLSQFQAIWKMFNHMAYQRACDQSLTETTIFQLYNALHKGIVEEEHVYQTMDEALYANLDVTMGGLSWNLVFLASDQQVQSQLREEIKQVRRDNNEHQYLLSSTTFLFACISESSRLKPLAAFSVPQSAPTDRIIDGYVIPAGTNFVVDSYSLNIRNGFWGSDATEYRPNRFQTVNSTDARYNFWRFGFGPRQCMGRYVADIIIRALILELIDKWELHLPKELVGKNWGMKLICVPNLPDEKTET
ncbi:hypothetical protein N7488_004798 [Penicillium malachiteum]|nr:hypothetical protein N7488_004798 [Penicillium malachiteum]